MPPIWTPAPSLTFLPYQQEAMDYLLARKVDGALFMEMRLGKTLVMVRHAIMSDAEKILIVAPYQVVNTWFKHLIGERVSVDDICTPTWDFTSKKKRLEALTNPKHRFYVMNFESVANLDVATLHKWDMVIVDESYRIASPRSGVTKYFLRRLGQRFVPQRYILSGLPDPEGPMNLVTQLIYQRGSCLSARNYWEFRAMHCTDADPWKDTLKAESYRILRHTMHANCFLKTRKEAGVGPEKVYMTRRVKMSPDQKRAYRSMLTKWEADGVEVKHQLSQAVALSRISAGLVLPQEGDAKDYYKIRSYNKLNELIHLLSGEFAGQQVVVWAHLINEIRMISKALTAAGFGNRMIYGDVPITEREVIREQFQIGMFPVVVMQAKTAKAGLDFSAADTAIYYSNELDGDSRGQSEDRVVHLRKTGDTVLIIDLVSADSIDEDIVDLLIEKKVSASVFKTQLYRRLEAAK